jgi:hypothetical protein
MKNSSKQIIGFSAMAAILVVAGLLIALVLDVIEKDSFNETSKKALMIIGVLSLSGFAMIATGHLLSSNDSRK